MKRAKAIALALSFGGFTLLTSQPAVATPDFAHGAQRDGVCIVDSTGRTLCFNGDMPSYNSIRATVKSAINGSSFAVKLLALYGDGSKCINPGDAGLYPGGYAIKAVQIGPEAQCAGWDTA